MAGETFAPLPERLCRLYAVPNAKAEADCKVLARYIRSKSDRFRARLLTLHAQDVLYALDAYYPALEVGPADALPVHRSNSEESESSAGSSIGRQDSTRRTGSSSRQDSTRRTGSAIGRQDSVRSIGKRGTPA